MESKAIWDGQIFFVGFAPIGRGERRMGTTRIDRCTSLIPVFQVAMKTKNSKGIYTNVFRFPGTTANSLVSQVLNLKRISYFFFFFLVCLVHPLLFFLGLRGNNRWNYQVYNDRSRHHKWYKLYPLTARKLQNSTKCGKNWQWSEIVWELNSDDTRYSFHFGFFVTWQRGRHARIHARRVARSKVEESSFVFFHLFSLEKESDWNLQMLSYLWRPPKYCSFCLHFWLRRSLIFQPQEHYTAASQIGRKFRHVWQHLK